MRTNRDKACAFHSDVDVCIDVQLEQSVHSTVLQPWEYGICLQGISRVGNDKGRDAVGKKSAREAGTDGTIYSKNGRSRFQICGFPSCPRPCPTHPSIPSPPPRQTALMTCFFRGTHRFPSRLFLNCLIRKSIPKSGHKAAKRLRLFHLWALGISPAKKQTRGRSSRET